MGIFYNHFLLFCNRRIQFTLPSHLTPRAANFSGEERRVSFDTGKAKFKWTNYFTTSYKCMKFSQKCTSQCLIRERWHLPGPRASDMKVLVKIEKTSGPYSQLYIKGYLPQPRYSWFFFILYQSSHFGDRLPQVKFICSLGTRRQVCS